MTTGPLAKLRRLLAHHEETAKAIRLTLELLDGNERTAKVASHQTVLASALELDHARTETRVATKKTKKTRRRQTMVARGDRRAKTEAYLAQFDPKTPRRVPDKARTVGSMVRYGYLKVKGDGYVRTGKDFTP